MSTTQPLTNRSRVVSDKKMSLMERIYLPAMVGGLLITIKHFFRKKPTIQYPEQVRPRPAIYRGQHVLKRDDKGRERCTACGLCAQHGETRITHCQAPYENAGKVDQLPQKVPVRQWCSPSGRASECSACCAHRRG